MTPTPVDLLLEASRRGFRIKADGINLHITPQCPAEFAETVRSLKPRLLALLELTFVVVDSKAVGEILFFCADEATKMALLEAGADEWAIYTRDELWILCEQNRIAPISQAELCKMHDIKKTFNATIRE
jgi:hypothetical protein